MSHSSVKVIVFPLSGWVHVIMVGSSFIHVLGVSVTLGLHVLSCSSGYYSRMSSLFDWVPSSIHVIVY